MHPMGKLGQGLAIALVASLFLLPACRQGDRGLPPPTFTPVVPLATVQPGQPIVCAVGSTEDFRRIQEKAPFKVYCPTTLPEGFQLAELALEPLAGAEATPEGPTSLRATFSRREPPATIVLLQGQLKLEDISEFRLRDSRLIGVTAYGDFLGNLFPEIVLARSPDEYSHQIAVEGLSTEELLMIAAGMRPVTP